MTLLPIASVVQVAVALWVIFKLGIIIKTLTMKKLIFATCALAIGLWSCSSNDDTEIPSDGYVNVTLGIQSEGAQSSVPKSIVGAGGVTSWNTIDKVKIIDVDGAEQLFTYASETPKSSAQFAGKLKTGQGKKIYKAYHIPEKSNVTLKNGHFLDIERKNIEITGYDGMTSIAAIYGTYCPMVAVPFEFNADDKKETKVAQFYHLGTMIEARVTLRETEDSEYLEKFVDKIVYEVKATNSKPFNTKIEFDLDKLTTSSSVLDLIKCIEYPTSDTEKTDNMVTTITMVDRSIKDLMDEYKSLKFFPVPIFALPTKDKFKYTATISFYHQGAVQLKMEGNSEATGLNPVGLNILNFDYKKIKP